MEDDCTIDTVYKYDTNPMYYNNSDYFAVLKYLKIKLYPFCRDFVFEDFFQLLARGDVDVTTSPGWPFSNVYNDKDACLSDLDFVNLLIKETWKKHYPFTSFPKKEIKVRISKVTGQPKPVRQICGCPIDYLYHLLPLVHHFNKSIEVKGRGLPFFLGTTFMHSDLKAYIDNFSGFSRGISTDRSSHDSTVARDRHQLITDLRCEFLPAEYHEKLRFLYAQAGHKYIIEPDGAIYEVDHGMASGHPCTAHDNTIIVYADTLVMFRNFGLTFAEIESNIRLAIYGDDCNIYIRDGWEPPFSPIDIRNWHSSMGINIKCPDNWRDSFALDFLSRVPIKIGDYISVYQDRHEKFYASAIHSDLKMSDVDRLMKYVQLRNASAGSPTFSKLDKKCLDELQRLKELYSDDPNYIAARTLMNSEEIILRGQGYRIDQALGPVFLKSRQPKVLQFSMSEKVEIKVEAPKRNKRAPRQRITIANRPKVSNSQMGKSKQKNVRRPIRKQKNGKATATLNDARAPLAVARTMQTYFTGGQKELVLTGRDYLMTQMSNSTPSALNISSSLAINPGNAAVFKKAANVAQNYNRWTFTEITLLYVPACPATTSGEVVAYADTDPEAPDTVNISEIMNKNLVASDVPWSERGIILKIDPKKIKSSSPSWLVQTYAQLSTLETAGNWASLRQCVPFYFIFGTYGGPSTSVMQGHWYIEYKIKLMEFQPQPDASMLLTMNPVNLANGDQTPQVMTSSTATSYGFDATYPVSGDITDFKNGDTIYMTSPYNGNLKFTNRNSVPVSDNANIRAAWSVNAGAAPPATEEYKAERKDIEACLRRRKAITDAYWAQIHEGVDEKNPIYLKDLPAFRPTYIKNVNGVVCYYDPVLEEWIACPTPDERQRAIIQIGYVAGDISFSSFLGNVLGNSINAIYSVVVNDYNYIFEAMDLVLDLTGVGDYVASWFTTVVPSTANPTRTLNYGTKGIAPINASPSS